MTIAHPSQGTSRRIVHFSSPTPVLLVPKIQSYFKGTKVTLVPSGIRNVFTIVGPYGARMPWWWVQKSNGRYFFMERRIEE